MSILLAIETTERFGSVALLNDSVLLSETALPHDRRSTQTLAPAMNDILRRSGVRPQQVDTVAAVVGPGSFTGLRTGISAAKVFAYAVGAKIVAVNTFETLAAAVAEQPEPPKFLTAGVDAQRGEVAVQTFRYNCSEYEPFDASALLPLADWLKQAEEKPDLFYTGPALERYRGKMFGVQLTEEKFWFPQASAAGKLALNKQAAETPFSLLPLYSRLSAAEERLTAS
ncbi:MAG: tRNA (adenosine(37)-N6)-threonylcarbamoyltransferase complex dimerization subunit type 1 TsaB [Planctomycetaceae bacterium]|nr:tRNA (adenosine(37)-N6)-threonylcarbamoyltransferase complex dimerization subunit type 1 TsaB [Planctomycetaceae bacterium]